MVDPITDAEIARLEATPLEYAPICAMLISRLRAAERERDEALSRLATVRDEWHVERAARRAAEAKLRLVATPAEGVWRWQDDGDDRPQSLGCPVVMSADTLRDILSRGRAVQAPGGKDGT